MRKMNETEAARVLDHFRHRGVAGVHEHPCICRIRSIMIRVDPGHLRLLPGALLGPGRGHRRRDDASSGSPGPCARAPRLGHRTNIVCAPARPSPSRPRERRRRSHFPLPRSTISVSRTKWIFLPVAFIACHLVQRAGGGREEVARTTPAVAAGPGKACFAAHCHCRRHSASQGMGIQAGTSAKILSIQQWLSTRSDRSSGGIAD